MAHVQPTGAYHYHGLPGFLGLLGLDGSQHSPLVGWAADGFPIYVRFGHTTPGDVSSPIVELRSSYRLRSGKRPEGDGSPGGRYDGTFVADYEYVEGSGDLDRCNGRQTVTPGFAGGTYAYFLTEAWPVIPRCFVGTPDPSFERRGPHGRRGGGPAGRHRPPRHPQHQPPAGPR